MILQHKHDQINHDCFINFKNNFTQMKNLILAVMATIAFGACGINKQAQQIKALEKCEYKFIDASNITIAGSDVKKIMKGNTIDISNLPGLAMGYLRKDIPLRANINLEIFNPSADKAAINNFEYIILINSQEIATGLMNQQVSIDAGQKVNVPLQLNTNVYNLVTNQKVFKDVTDFISAGKSGTEKKGMVTLKIKPSFMVGNTLVKYPGFITIDKEVSSKILL
jgi:hypothetical protein